MRRLEVAKAEKKIREDAQRVSNKLIELIERTPNPVEKELAEARQINKQNQRAVIEQEGVVKTHQSNVATLTTARDAMLDHAVSEGKQSVDARIKKRKQEAEEAKAAAEEAKAAAEEAERERAQMRIIIGSL